MKERTVQDVQDEYDHQEKTKRELHLLREAVALLPPAYQDEVAAYLKSQEK